MKVRVSVCVWGNTVDAITEVPEVHLSDLQFNVQKICISTLKGKKKDFNDYMFG